MKRGTILVLLTTGLIVAIAALVVEVIGPSAPRIVRRELRSPTVFERHDEAPRPGPSGRHTLYIVLDDAGHDVAHVRRLASIDVPLTIAVLPQLRATAESARAAAELGFEVILHQPMEALGGNATGPSAVLVSDSDDAIRRTVRRNLHAIPHAVGLNNHMGSRATSDPRVMGAVMRAIAGTPLYFLDSRTIHTSVAPVAARAAGVTVLQRDVFLDNVREPEAIRARLAEGLEVASQKGYAVLIGHVTAPELAVVLREEYQRIREAGFSFAPLSDLAARQTARRVATLSRRSPVP